MYVESYFKSGDYVELVPIGLPITLQYNVSGNLEKVFIGYAQDRRDVTDTFCTEILNRCYAPGKISLTKGTSWVYGILYTGDIPTDVCGAIPECLISIYENKFIEHPEQFRFFAGSVECTSAQFMNATHITQFLHVSKFRVLPGWIVPPKMDKSVFDKWVNSSEFSFRKVVTNYITTANGKTEFHNTYVSQHIVKSFNHYVDDNGFYRCKAVYENNNTKYMPYSEAYQFGITEGTLVYTDVKGNIFDTVGSIEMADTIKCPFCGKIYQADVSFGEESICSDIHCVSRLVRPIERFLAVMGMPKMSTDDIKVAIKSHTITCIPDLFLIEPYKNMSIEATVGKCLQAMIPISLIQKLDIYGLFTTACSNDLKTIEYYINNPGDIAADLKINHPDLNRLVSWLSDDCNVSDLNTVLESEQIKIQQAEKFFNGAPIFRNKLIYITGDFIHGNTSEIAAILQSYSAQVTTTYSDLVDCVLVGGTNENVSGKSIVSARNMGIPIMQEVDFFNQYDIDTDLANIV